MKTNIRQNEDNSVYAEVMEIYREADQAVAAAGPKCEASGRCCRFKEHGHRLYISNLEAAVLLRDAPTYDVPVTDAGCPFQINGLCTTRDPRPLACRVYFCDPTYQETAQDISEKFLQRLKRLATENDIEWEYAPLHVFLNKTNNNLVETAPPTVCNDRIALPMAH